ncbi:hypothetical protein LSAT2_010462, partial [Lamellibrachia satsuma]
RLDTDWTTHVVAYVQYVATQCTKCLANLEHHLKEAEVIFDIEEGVSTVEILAGSQFYGTSSLLQAFPLGLRGQAMDGSSSRRPCLRCGENCPGFTIHYWSTSHRCMGKESSSGGWVGDRFYF